MLAAPGAIASPQNLPRIILRTKVLFCSAFTRHKPCPLIALSPTRPRDFAGTTRKVGAIEIVAIAATPALDLRASPRLLRSIRPKPQLEIIMIVAVTGHHIRKIGTWARSPITIVTRRGILLTNASSPTSQKTSIGFGNLLVGDQC